LPALPALAALPARYAAFPAGGSEDREQAPRHAVGRLTGRPVLGSGLRQLALGGVAVAVTFAVGSLIGSQVR
jgi:hypothetical protein